jgi:hypothetical protein
MQKVRIHVGAQGAEVMVNHKWVPADPRVLENVMNMMKEGLPDKPEFAEERK